MANDGRQPKAVRKRRICGGFSSALGQPDLKSFISVSPKARNRDVFSAGTPGSSGRIKGARSIAFPRRILIEINDSVWEVALMQVDPLSKGRGTSRTVDPGD
jgi:hypothetical protein